MRFGLWYATVGPYASPDGARTLAVAAEAAGVESLWAGEHVAVPADYASPYPYSDDGRMAGDGAVDVAEPFVWFAWVAGQTTRLKFVTGVLVLPQRQPLLVAKQAATLAVLSEDRLVLGVGGGWLREEFAALGADFDTRAGMLDEAIQAIQAMRAVWADDVASFEGDHVSFPPLRVTPRPPSGRIPIVIGGHTRAAAKRAGRLGDGFFPAKGSPEKLAVLFDVVRQSAAEVGRDPSSIEVSVHDPTVLDPATAPESIEAWKRLGVDRIIVSPTSLDPAEQADRLAAFGEDVIAHVR